LDASLEGYRTRRSAATRCETVSWRLSLHVPPVVAACCAADPAFGEQLGVKSRDVV